MVVQTLELVGSRRHEGQTNVRRLATLEGHTRRVVAVLVTGMSGAGKSSALRALAGRGFEVVDTDEPGWIEVVGGERLWREDRVAALLDRARDHPVVVGQPAASAGRSGPPSTRSEAPSRKRSDVDVKAKIDIGRGLPASNAPVLCGALAQHNRDVVLRYTKPIEPTHNLAVEVPLCIDRATDEAVDGHERVKLWLSQVRGSRKAVRLVRDEANMLVAWGILKPATSASWTASMIAASSAGLYWRRTSMRELGTCPVWSSDACGQLPTPWPRNRHTGATSLPLEAPMQTQPTFPSTDLTVDDDPERGDVPGWVLVTMMTAGLVVLLWGVAGPALTGLFNQAITSVSGL